MFNNPTLATLEDIRAGWILRVARMRVEHEKYAKEIVELEQLIKDLSNVMDELQETK